MQRKMILSIIVEVAGLKWCVVNHTLLKHAEALLPSPKFCSFFQHLCQLLVSGEKTLLCGVWMCSYFCDNEFWFFLWLTYWLWLWHFFQWVLSMCSSFIVSCQKLFFLYFQSNNRQIKMLLMISVLSLKSCKKWFSSQIKIRPTKGHISWTSVNDCQDYLPWST